MFPSDRATDVLTQMTNGDEAAGEQLAPLVYDELRRLAARFMRRERPDHTLQPTALVHEAYLRLAGQQADWRNRAHFLGIAARQMSRVLKDYGRKHRARPEGKGKVSIDSSGRWTRRNELGAALGVRQSRTATALSIERALAQLGQRHPRQAEVARMRCFSGCTEEEIGEVLKRSVETIRGDWRFAKAWLKAELG